MSSTNSTICNLQPKTLERVLKKAFSLLYGNLEIVESGSSDTRAFTVLASVCSYWRQTLADWPASNRRRLTDRLESLIKMRMDLLLAAYHGRLDEVQDLIQKGTDVNASAFDGQSALFFACENGHYDVAVFLLKKGALVDRVKPFAAKRIAYQHLLVAARCGHCASLVEIINIPLIIACKRRHHEIVRLLLEHGANVHVTDTAKQSALLHALKSISSDNSESDLSTVNLLLDYGADTNAMASSGENPLYLACSKGLTAVVQRMFKCGAKVTVGKDQKSPLIAACERNHTAIVELLLSEGADPNAPEDISDKCSTSCSNSCLFVHVQILALHAAAARHNNELINLLLKHGANVRMKDAFGNTVLHHAIENFAFTNSTSHKVVLDTLLKAGAGVNISNDDGESPLYLAIEKGLLDDVSGLLSYGANRNLIVERGFSQIIRNATKKNVSLLGVACEEQNLPVVEMLLKAGADPNLTPADTDPPLCVAVRNVNKEIAKKLLSSGAEVNVLNRQAKNALHLALDNLICYYNSRCAEIVKLLLVHGADVNQLMPDGGSPLSLLLNYVLSFRHQNQYEQTDIFRMMIISGANLSDSSNNLRGNFVPREIRIIESLCAWRCTDRVAVDLLKAGAGFRLLAFYCRPDSAHTSVDLKKSVRVCQAAIMAGYRPTSDELIHMQHSEIPEHEELLSWLNEDKQQTPSLMRQCRVAIRRQLSVASCHRTILPAIDQLPLPKGPRILQQYLKFEGPRTEIDFSV